MDLAGRGGGAASTPAKRRVMVVADPGRESAAALQWALSHAILEHDELILLHVDAPNSGSRRGGAFSVFLRRPTSIGPGGGGSLIGWSNHHSPLALVSSSSLSLPSMGSAANGTGEGEYEFLDAMRAACEAAQPNVRVQIERVEMEGRDKAAAILFRRRRFSGSIYSSSASDVLHPPSWGIGTSVCLFACSGSEQAMG
ncbi:hypothetical protein HPP92_022376 [Vanilla planifolia]|uniref:UspA domain-containing protein n=1 Tax=Vanilla planifolia TaxID=51239 RepID=A0A835UFD0_VANPL|nr:hypothetical protein HPP92_022376 [Vanilla planifolia]